MFNLKGTDTDKYFKEVESKLLEETDYELELKQSEWIADSCKVIPDLLFPKYYPELSGGKILTMDWMQGKHLSEHASQGSSSQEQNDLLGQTLWDFYMFQIHVLKKVHADPHPGNFLINSDLKLVALDFGCVKEIPDEFYEPYFELPKHQFSEDPKKFKDILRDLEILRADDTPEEIEYFTQLFGRMMKVLTLPFTKDNFDFGDSAFWKSINSLSEELSTDKRIRKMNGNRGSKHFLYINRTFFGLYNLLFDLKAKVKTENYLNYI